MAAKNRNAAKDDKTYILRPAMSSRNALSNANLAKAFNPIIDYDIILATMSQEFLKKYENNTPSPEIGLEGYEERAVLGAGSFGKVKLVRDKTGTNYYACKMLLKDQIVKTKQVAHILNEKRILKAIKFPFLVHLIFSSKDNDYLYIGLPLVNGGELFTYQRKVRKFSEKQARFYAAQVFLAFEYMHSNLLLYRDLKPENILITHKGYLKITDFGFAKKVETRTMTLCGTPEYLAPEIIQSKPYGASVDWWAFGVLVYEFVNGNSPFAPFNRDVMVMYGKICDGDFKMPGFFSSTLRDLIDNLLQVDTSKRFGSMSNGSKDIRNHEWFQSLDWFAILNQEISAPFVPTIAHMEDTSNFEPTADTKIIKSKINKHADTFSEF